MLSRKGSGIRWRTAVPRWHNELGIAWSLRFLRSRHLVDLDRAIAALRHAADSIGPSRPQRPQYLGELGYFLRIRFDLTGDRFDLEAAADCLRVAATADDTRLRQGAQAELEAVREELAK